MDIPVL